MELIDVDGEGGRDDSAGARAAVGGFAASFDVAAKLDTAFNKFGASFGDFNELDAVLYISEIVGCIPCGFDVAAGALGIFKSAGNAFAACGGVGACST